VRRGRSATRALSRFEDVWRLMRTYE
jgi:hypothetical protein